MKSKPWKMEMDLSGSLSIDGCDLGKRIRDMRLETARGCNLGWTGTPICISGLLVPAGDIMIHTRNQLIHV